MDIRVMFAVCILLVFSGCAVSQEPAGSGVHTSVMNRAELANMYVPINSMNSDAVRNPEFTSIDGNRYVRAAGLNLLVHNRGYADSLAALYISGYDPNLFVVRPKGPFVMQSDSRFCYRDLIIESLHKYSVFTSCALNEDVFVSGGLTQDGSSSSVNVGAYSRNIAAFAATLLGFDDISETGFFKTFSDSLGGVYLNCDVPLSQGEGSSSGGCSLSPEFVDFLSRQDTRGSLLLALHGHSVSTCKNDCVVVPSPRLPRNFIAGDTVDFPGGEQFFVEYDIFLNEDRWPANYNSHDQLFQINTCYLYTTYATPIVCIDPAPQNSDGAICRAGVQQLNHGQPAPLKITSIEQTNQGPRVMFTIHVENTLGGRVFNPGAIDYCAPGAPESYARELRDVAKVIDARVIGDLKALDCRDDTIRLQNNRGQITCFYDIPSEAYRSGAYQTTLNIEIGYLYRDIQTVQATINRI